MKKTTTGKRRINGEGTVYKRSDGRWCASVITQINNESERKYFYGKTQGEAKKKMDDFLYDVKTGQYAGGAESRLGEYISNWLEDFKYTELKSSSYDRLESTIKNHVTPKLGHYKLNQLNASIIQRNLINRMYKDGFSHSSIKKAYDALNACLKHAVIDDGLNKNPMDLVNLPAKHKFEEKEIRFLSDDEIERFKKVAQSRYKNGKLKHKHGEGFIVMLYTGLRDGEARAINLKTDIDLDKRRLTINKNLVYVYDRTTTPHKRELKLQKGTKYGTTRSVPLNKTARQSVKKILESGQKTMFEGSDGGYLSYSSMNKSFKRILRETGIEECGLHTLRHTFASMLFRKGIDEKTVSKLLGHKDVAFTYNTYIHLIEEQKEFAVDLLDVI